MTDHSKDDMKHLIVQDLLSGLMAQEHDLGADGSHLIQLLRAAGYKCPDELYCDLSAKWLEKDDFTQHH